MSIQLIDNGTRATVFQCSLCGQEQRYHFATCDHTCVLGTDGCDCYSDFLDWCLEDFDSVHQCYSCELCNEPAGEGNALCPACATNR